MFRARINSPQLLVVVLFLTLIAALLPGRLLTWTRFPAEVTSIILAPFAVAGNTLGQMVRPAPLPSIDSGDEEYVRHLRSQLKEFERLYLAEQVKVSALEEQLEQLQRIPAEYRALPVRPVIAYVALRSPNNPLGLVTLNRGANQGVRPGTIAIYNGVHLIGRINNDILATQSTLVPLPNPSSGLLVCSVISADGEDELDITSAPKVQLKAVGDGTLEGQIEFSANNPIQIGDEVRLTDSTWPASAQALIIGTIEEIRPYDPEPLRRTLVIRPVYNVSSLSFVTLQIEEEQVDSPSDGEDQ